MSFGNNAIANMEAIWRTGSRRNARYTTGIEGGSRPKGRPIPISPGIDITRNSFRDQDINNWAMKADVPNQRIWLPAKGVIQLLYRIALCLIATPTWEVEAQPTPPFKTAM